MLNILLLACAPETTPSTPAESNVLDVRQEIPPEEEGMFNLVGPEQEVPAYEEVMYCSYISNTTGQDLIVPYADVYQGKFGHHATLLTSDDHKPDGTVEDCTSNASMANLHVYFIAGFELPEGDAVRIPAGTQFVLQSHYLNTGSVPILTRDVVRFHLMDEADVNEWAAPFATAHLGIDIPPNDSAEVTFDCSFPEDVRLSMMSGHMHEWGTKFVGSFGPDVDHLEQLVLIDPWRSEFRDDPPIQMYLENPMPMAAGTVIRTHCEWYNDTDETLAFPSEMCDTFGYMIGTDQSMECRVQ